MSAEKASFRPGPVAPEGFFDFMFRDQRTILTVDYACHCPRQVRLRREPIRYSTPLPSFPIYPQYSHLRGNSSSDKWFKSFSSVWCQIPGRINFKNIFKRLTDVFFLSVFLLSLLRFPIAMSAPVSRDDTDQPLPSQSNTPQWACPCGDSSDLDEDNEYGLVTGTLSDRDLLKHIIIQAKISLGEASKFKYEYVTRTFGVDYHEHHQNWRKNQLGWLPSYQQINKELGEAAGDDHLEKLAIDMALRDIFEFLQKVAVGLEQVVEDQVRSNGEFRQKFNQTQIALKSVLCEIQIAMIERNVTPKQDVSREIMNIEVRRLEDLSHRNLRDWLIFREYMNVLEYVIQVFEYILRRLPS